MADSPEHKFISESLDRALNTYSHTKLLGLAEAERRTFDYGCILLRDASRPLVSQVLWSHTEGIDKDLRFLIFEGGASLKLYFVRDRLKNRAKIDEVLGTFRRAPETKALLRGLRIIPIPDGFDSDKESEREWMDKHLLESVSTDLLFAVIFGRLEYRDVREFALHGGPLGLKLAALQLIASAEYQSLESSLRSKGPLREALARLAGIGLITSAGFSTVRVPTLKGRFFLDLARLLTFERNTRKSWSEETKLVLQHLRLDPASGWRDELTVAEIKDSPVDDILRSVQYSASQFGVDVMSDVDKHNPKFYSKFAVEKFMTQEFHGVSADLWNEPSDIVNFGS